MAHKNDNNDSSLAKERENFSCVLIPGGKLADANKPTVLNDDGDDGDGGQYNCNKEILPIKSGSDLIRFEFWAMPTLTFNAMGEKLK